MNNDNNKNPLFNRWKTPFNTIPFKEIETKDYEEALVEGIKREKEQTSKIIKSQERPTFDNTIIGNETEEESWYFGLLGRSTTAFFNLLSAETNDSLDELATKIQPLLAKHSSEMMMNEQLFAKIKRVHQYHRRLDKEEKMLLDNCYEGFVRSGALLSSEDKNKLKAMNEEMAALSLAFSQNLLKETKAFTLVLDNEQQLAGLPPSAKEAAKEAAKERNANGWIITLDGPSYSSFMTYSDCRELREQLYKAHSTLCSRGGDNDNREICKRIVNIRRERAQLLGYKCFADMVLKHRMAGKRITVNRFLESLLKAYKPTAQREMKTLKNYAKRLEGRNFELQAWDIAYYSHKLKKSKYDIDSEMLRPYFELSRVIDGVFGLANKLYGISFKKRTDIQTYHKDVNVYEVSDFDGKYLGLLYTDFHPRKGKQGGAWMTEYQGQYINRKGENIRPHASIVLNLSKPTSDKPALLTLSEVETFLHEFGHSLHGLFANTRFESLSGTNVWWDFVELPSQIMENFAVEKDFLKTFAIHYETGEPMPDALIERIKESRNFMSATACLRQLSLAMLDMAYYSMKKPLEGEIVEFEKRAWKQAIVTPQSDEACMSTQFSHIMAGGYAAGYYSYKWAEVLDADAFSVFKKNGIFDRKTAQHFRECILSKGGTEHPMALYRQFKGGEPNIKALLKRNGIKK